MAATKSVQFERVMSFRPQLAVLSKEPCLRDMIHHYYSDRLANPEEADALTKQYIEKLWQANLI